MAMEAEKSNSAPQQQARRLRGIHSPALVLAVLWLMILAYTGFFSADSIRQHDAFLTKNADLGILDQTIWNTLHGRPLVRTYEGEQVTRLGDHVQLFLIPLSLSFLVWDDVRVLLVLQSLVTALGALPVYWLARDELRRSGVGQRACEAVGLTLAGVYLLFPALEAANRTEFHVSLFAVLPMLLALYHARGGRHGPMWLSALAVMSIKEEMALLTLMLGLLLLLSRRQRFQGLGLMAVSAAWFGIATFGIVPRFSEATRGTEQAYYFQRYAALGDTPLGAARTILTKPGLVWSILTEPARLRYLGGLLVAAGLLLPLLAPEILLIGLPLLLANMLSDYEAMYSGVYQYSAPVVPLFVAAAAVGLGRATRLVRGPRRVRLATGLAALLLAVSLGNHRLHGETPLARGYAWPDVTAHDRLFAQRFLPQVPAGVVLSASNHLYPHLSHRERILQFPLVQDAQWAMLDVASERSMAPDDVREAYEDLIESGEWCIVDAADGYILLERRGGPAASGRAACQVELPDGFYTFVHASGGQPAFRVEAAFGPLRLLGYDILEQPFHRRVGVRLYWTWTGGPREETADLLPVVTWLGENGKVVGTSRERPFVELTWYPTGRWSMGQVVRTETMLWDMGQAFRIGLAVEDAQGCSLSVQLDGADGSAAYVMENASWLRLPAFRWEGARSYRRVVAVDEGALSEPLGTLFAESISLDGFETAPDRPAAGSELEVRLTWSKATRSLGTDYTVFVHLLNAEGETVALGDSMPGYLGTLPTTVWREDAPVLDEHTLSLPPDLAQGTYRVVVGWYDPQTGERLVLPGGEDSLDLAGVRVQ